MNEYYKCYVKCAITKIVNGQIDVHPNLPVQVHSFVAVSYGKFIHDNLVNQENGQQCIALVHVKAEDELNIKNYSGYIGDTKESVLNDPDYSTHYNYTIADQKRQVLPDDTVIEYEGEDADDKALFWEI